MRKRGKKLLAMMLALSMTMNVVSMQAFADEPVVTVEDATAEDLENVDIPEVKVEFDSTGKGEGEVTVKVSEETIDLIENGVDIGDETVITEIERIVEAELSKEETEDKSTVTIKPGVNPEEYDGKHYSDPYKKYQNEAEQWYADPNGLYPYNDVKKDFIGENVVNTPPADGYDFQASGMGDVVDAASSVTKYIVYQKDENGNPIPDGNGGFLIDEEKSHLIDPGDKFDDEHPEKFSGMDAQLSQIVVRKPKADGTGFDYFYTYCVDKGTEVGEATDWYKVTDIEDADYYSDEAAAHIRAIAENGYWGTESGTGSIAQMKELLREYAKNNPTVTVTDKEGNPVQKNLAELIDGLKEHEALAVTQAALWSYSNGAAVQNGKDGEVVIGVQSAIKFYNKRDDGSFGSLLQYDRDYDLNSDARLKALYECLMGLAGKDSQTQIDLEDKTKFNSITDTDLLIGDKVESFIVVDEATGESVDVNKDDKDDNDAYSTSVQFTLAIVPDQNSDDLVVFVMDGDTVLTAKRLAGKNGEGEAYDTITPDANGVYTLNGLVFQENSDVKFDLKLEGLQNLGDKGVYIFQAYGGTDKSQTLVGLGERVQEVDITKSMTLKFDVDEKKKVTAVRTWDEEDTSNDNGGGGNGGNNGGGGSTTTTTIQDTPTPLAAADTLEIFDGDVPLSDGAVLNIEDAQIPLAVLPMTGDVSVIWMLISLISGLGLAGVSFADRKKRR